MSGTARAGLRDTKLVDAGRRRWTRGAMKRQSRADRARASRRSAARCGPRPTTSAPRGRARVVLVSDGGDNCAPPEPCKAAELAKGGVELKI